MYIGGCWGEGYDEKLENGMYLSSLMIFEPRSGCDHEIRQFKQSKGQWRGRPEKAGETWMLKRPEMMAESGLGALLRDRISRGSEGGYRCYTSPSTGTPCCFQCSGILRRGLAPVPPASRGEACSAAAAVAAWPPLLF